MSQSPVDKKVSPSPHEYLQNWNKLGDRVSYGASFSGRERNCCFLNTGAGRFADVSSAVGLDRIEDGRGLALVDWDQDGDEDIWLANRNAPAVCMLRNDFPAQHHYLAVGLQGVSCNRDAIGARVEVHLPRDRRLIRTLRAGDAFASQSSKWLHFGVGRETKIARVVVRWPGGATESFAGVAVNHRYRLVQGTGTARSVALRSVTPLQPTAFQAPEASGNVRVLLTHRRQVPELNYNDFHGTSHSAYREGQNAVLINLWASWCEPCLAELREWSLRSDAFQQAGIDVVALSVDSIDPSSEQPTGSSAAAKIAKAFRTGLANRAVAKTLTELRNQLFYLKGPLPLPCSFLLDPSGRLAAIYEGRVSSQRLLADAASIRAERSEIYRLASPFGGRNVVGLFKPNPLSIAEAYMDGGYWHEAKTEAERLVASIRRQLDAKLPPEGRSNGGDLSRRELIPLSSGATVVDQQKWLIRAYQLLAEIHGQLGDWRRVVHARRAVVEFSPHDVRARIQLGVALHQFGQTAEASRVLQQAGQVIGHDARLLVELGKGFMKIGDSKSGLQTFELAAQLAREDAEVQMNLAIAYQLQGSFREAVDVYERVLVDHPDSNEATNNLAWLLATHADEALRNGQRAKRLASALCARTRHKNASYLDTLAAAQAATGEFAAATSTIHRALDLARQSELPQDVVQRMGQRLQLYASGRPYRE